MEKISENDCLAFFQVLDRRHLMFATNQQLDVLSRAKTWYVDGTFKLCRSPFKQLLTVNAFVRSGECTKQVPLLFVIKSGRNKKDYRISKLWPCVT